MSTELFYTDMRARNGAFEDVLASRKNFVPVPHDWYVIVTDIVNSTAEFAKGKYEELNIVASSTVATVMNAGKRHGIEIPFVYGGDGASLLVPPMLLDEVLRALVSVKHTAKKRFGLHLRIGAVPMTEIRRKKHDIQLAKFFMADAYPQAIFLDNGLYHAEEWVKQNKFITRKRAAKIPFQLEGLRCRWDHVPPPEGYEEIVCLIVNVPSFRMHERAYRSVLKKIHEIYGDFASRHPVNVDMLMRNVRLQSLVRESYAKQGKLDPLYVATHAIASLAQSLKHRVIGRGGSYDFIMTATDTLKVDGKLCTIIAGNPGQRETLVRYLENEEKKGNLFFGYAIAPSTTITCTIREPDYDYIHFVDGTGGGYIQAATMIKIKRNQPLDD